MNFLRTRRKKIGALLLAILLTALACAGIGIKNRIQTQVNELFRMNKELQEEGYYMAEFEFKLMGMAYWLDRGDYYTAIARLDEFHKQLARKENLIKVPAFAGKEDEMAFYLNLQNPRTGAFMDDSFPACTYNEVTENVLEHLSALAKETGQPLRLKYPLSYLDAINTPDTLRAFLEDMSQVGWVASKFPQTSFIFARSLLSYSNGEGVIHEHHLYNFSPEWQQALLQWFYDNQDPQTGFWGPKSRINGRLLKNDLTNTASIIKTFVDSDGNNRDASFPLRFRSEMFKTSLEVLAEPLPEDADLDEWHEWGLKMGKGVTMITRYLWKDASPEDRSKAKDLITDFVKICFEKYYVPEEGAFSHYPDSDHATLDGTGGNMGNLADIGFFSDQKQESLWGADRIPAPLGQTAVTTLTADNFARIANVAGVNSIRLYSAAPDTGKYTSNVLGVYYPKQTAVLDVMDLVPKLKEWMDHTPQSMGNWVSKETTAGKLASLEMDAPPVYRGKIPLDSVNEALRKNQGLVAIGFDVLQIPVCAAQFVLH